MSDTYDHSQDKLLHTLAQLGRVLDYTLPPICLLLVPYALYHALILAPGERVMGDVQRILYFHVGAAMASYLMLAILFTGSVCYLVFKRTEFYLLSQASAGVSLLFSSIVLTTGMLWGYSSWNTWWNWEPRLVSVLILWIFLITYCYIQSIKFQAGEPGKAVISSVLGILCALQVPLIIFSIKLLERTQQLHPEVVATQGLTSSGYKVALLLGNIAVMLLAIWLCRLAYRRNILGFKLREYQKRSLIADFSN